MRVATLTHIALALAGFLSVSNLLRLTAPGPELVASTPKLEYLAEHVAEYDALFLGSSRVYRHFVPEVIDERLAELGVPLRTFNLGTPGAGSFEVDGLLRSALALEGARFKYVFIEPTDWTPSIFEANRETERTIAWHTVTGTRKALEATWSRDEGWRQVLALSFMHVRLFGWHLSNLGQGERVLRGLRGAPTRQEVTVADVGRLAGYWPLEFEQTEEMAARHRELVRDRPGFESKLSSLPYAGALTRAGVDRSAELTEEQMQVVRDAGAEPIYVIPPGTIATRLFYAQGKFGQLDTLLAFNDPAKFPDYYDYELFFDRNHLTQEGARIFSRLFAEHFVSWLKGEQPSSVVDENS